MGWIVDAMAVTEPQGPQYWGDLTCGPLGTGVVAKTRKRNIDYFRHIAVYRKVPLLALEAGHQVLGVVVANEIQTYTAPDLFAAAMRQRTTLVTPCTWMS